MFEVNKKAYIAPIFELVQFKLDNVLANQLTSIETPLEDAEEDMDGVGSGADA